MPTNLDLPSSRRVGSSTIIPNSSPTAMSTASQPSSRSCSYGDQDSKLLSFKGQRVDVLLPSITPEISKWIDDVILNVRVIHALAWEEVSRRIYVWLRV